MAITFWLLLSLIVYCYFGYPLLIGLTAKLFRRPVAKKDFEPTVSIVLSVWNEEDVIGGKIKNLLSLDYPKGKMEILVGSDGSTDKTDAIIKGFDDDRIRLVESDQRRGKMATINELVKKANKEIVVFTDARQLFAKDTVNELAANFSDPRVGCVSGELVFSKEEGGTAKGINLYWNYEKFIRSQESALHSMLGATGAVYGVRRELFSEIPRNVILDDMYVPLKIIQQGYRAVFDDAAKAYDQVADGPREEHRRKARTLFGNYQIFGKFSALFNPLNSPVAIQFFSHKLLRVLMPFVLIAVFIVNWFLCRGDPSGRPTVFYNYVFILQIIFYAMAIAGGLARNQKYGILKLISRCCYVPYVFCLLNFSALIGFLRFAGSRQEVTWEKARD